MEQLYNAFSQLNIKVNEEALLKFERFKELVLSWNEKVNLTSITDENDFIKKHLIDSILCADFDEIKRAENIIDVGTGAGFPGVPLALVFPEKQFLLMDSTGKKVKILNEMVKTLELPNIKTIHARAEDLAHNEGHREKYDLCVSRAVANLAVLSEYCLPFVKIGGSFISYKGPDTGEEVKAAGKAVQTLGGKVACIKKASLEGWGLDHSFIIIGKNKKTPEKYPRRAGIPAKEPLL